MTKLKLHTKQESRYNDAVDSNIKLAIYRGGISKALDVANKLPGWLGEATILQLRNSLERMKVSLDNNDTEGAEKVLGEAMKLYDSSTLIPIGYAWKGKELEKAPAEERLKLALDFGNRYLSLRRDLDLARQAKDVDIGELERLAA